MSFLDQIDKSRDEVRRLCKTTPHIFPQWLRYQHAKRELAEAMRKHQQAKREWESFKRGDKQ